VRFRSHRQTSGARSTAITKTLPTVRLIQIISSDVAMTWGGAEGNFELNNRLAVSTYALISSVPMDRAALGSRRAAARGPSQPAALRARIIGPDAIDELIAPRRWHLP
jgi:hypothetical protein